MKSLFGTTIAIVASASMAMSQQENLKIKGIILDNLSQPIPYANINVHSTADSVLVNGVASNEDGTFEIQMAEGGYYLDISFFGLNNKVVRLQQSKGNLDLGKISLLESKSTLLAGIEVVAERNQMALQIDKRVFNVGADLNSQGANATEVLQNIPSVTVDPEGNVSLRGSQAVRILIDGKLSGFASSADALQQLQADMIDKVEIITNASARYEAQGESGIINIILKKNKKAGFNGSANIRGGYYPDDGIGFNGNFRKNKLNINAALNYNYRRAVGRSTTHQVLQHADTAFIYDQGYEHNRRKHGLSVNVGADYTINSKNTIGASLALRTGLGNNTIDRTYDNFKIDGSPLGFDTRIEEQTEDELMKELTLNYERKFNNAATWKTSIRLMQDEDLEDSEYTETSTSYTGSLQERSNAYVTENMYLLQSDVHLPLTEKANLEFGVRGHRKDFDNKFGYARLMGSDWLSNPRFNDRFNYEERVYAAYVMGNRKFNELSVQAGLRAEYSEVYTLQYSLNNGDTRDYFNLFPSLALSYAPTQLYTYQLSYSRRINRPGQWDLLPFMKFGDNRNMRMGNPELDPELTDAYEASMLRSFDQGSVLGSVYYRHTKNKFDRINFLGDDGVIYSQAMNIATRDALGLELNGNYSVTKWLRITTGFNFFREAIKGNLAHQDFSYDNFSWTNRSSVNLSLPQRWRFQLSGNYDAPQINAQGKRLSVYHFDFAFSKDVLKNKGSIGFNVNDVLNSRKWRGIVSTDEIQSETMFQWRQRSARVTFTYRFNQQKREQENLIDRNMGGEE
jgi:outer membrane receptor protein involved in Fe transport